MRSGLTWNTHSLVRPDTVVRNAQHDVPSPELRRIMPPARPRQHCGGRRHWHENDIDPLRCKLSIAGSYGAGLRRGVRVALLRLVNESWPGAVHNESDAEPASAWGEALGCPSAAALCGAPGLTAQRQPCGRGGVGKRSRHPPPAQRSPACITGSADSVSVAGARAPSRPHGCLRLRGRSTLRDPIGHLCGGVRAWVSSFSA